MKQLHLLIDDDLAKVLAKYPNKSEIVRDALNMYNKSITTDTLAGMRQAFKAVLTETAETRQAVNDLYTLTSDIKTTIDSLLNR